MTNQTVILEILEILEAKYSYHNISYNILCNSIKKDSEIAELWGNRQLPTMEEFDNALCSEIYTIDTEVREPSKSFFVVLLYMIASLIAFTLAVKHSSFYLLVMGFIFVKFSLIFLIGRSIINNKNF